MNLKEIAQKLEQQSKQYHYAAQMLMDLASDKPEATKKPIAIVRSLSPEARQRISTAQKARWKKIKAA